MVSLIIPAYNESKIIMNTLRSAAEYLKDNFNSFEIIVVDDGSSDDTANLVKNECSQWAYRPQVVALPRNMGKGAAVREGAARAAGEFVFFTDADFPYSLDFVKAGAEMLKTCGVVCGNRYGDYPFLRKALSAVYNFFIKKLLRIDVKDIQCGIKGFTRGAARRIFSNCRVDGYAFDTEVIFLAKLMGYDIKPLDVKLAHRSESKVNVLVDGARMMRDIMKIHKRFKAGEYNFDGSCR